MTEIHPQLWVALSFAAATFQTLRFMLQKVLSTNTLSPTGATFARFLFSAPIIVVALVLYVLVTAQSVAWPRAVFWVFAIMGGTAQVLATVCVVTLFKTRNFAVGLAFMKTEVILSVIVGLLLLNEGVSFVAFGFIALGLVGVLLLSTPPQSTGLGWSGIANKSMGLGLASGMLFAVSAVSYRGASLEIDVADPFLRAGITLAVVTSLQTVGMLIWLWLRDRPQITAVWSARRIAVWIGLMSMAGSFCWFCAFTLQTAAYVKAVGQVELVLSLLASVLFFGERSSTRELFGMAVLTASIIGLILLI